MPPLLQSPPTTRTVGRGIPYKVAYRTVHVEQPVFVDRLYERPVLKEVEYEKPVIRIVKIDQPVEIPRVVFKDTIVERPVFKDVIVDRITYRDVVIERPVFKDKHIDVEKVTIRETSEIVHKPIPVQYEKAVFVERLVEVPVFKQVPAKMLCPRCGVMEVK